MRVPLSWLTEVVPALAGRSAEDVAELLIRAGVEVEEINGGDVTGPLLVGEVLAVDDLAGFKKPIRFCQVDVGEPDPRGIVCGARNFAPGDRVVVSLPGVVLPGGFAITARETYGHVSDGMICSARELGLGDDHSGIMVLGSDTSVPAGTDAVDLLGLNDRVLVTEPTPDRGYQLCIRGIGRELAALLDVDFADPATPSGASVIPRPGEGGGFPVEVADPQRCDRFAVRVLRGVDPAAPTPAFIASRLVRAGMRSISLAVDVTNYVTLLLGQPMHVYDLDRLRAPIVVRLARPGEALRTLDDVERRLDADDLLITDGAGIQGLAGVMGGAAAEVSGGTSAILLEAAHFTPRGISRTIRRHGLLSEAGRRFERGVDPQLPAAALQIAADLLVRFGGGSAEDVVVDVAAVPEPAPIRISAAAVSRLVGVEYTPRDVAHRLAQVGCSVRSGEMLTVVPPSWRPDLQDPADYAEEVARLAGYDRIPSVLPAAPAGRGLTTRQRHRRIASRTTAYLGYVETPSFPFLAAGALDALRIEPSDPRRRLVAVANPRSREQPYLRSTLLPGLLSALTRNVGRGMPDIAVFETGTVFGESGARRPPAPDLDPLRRPSHAELAALDAALPTQREHLALAASGAAEPAGWWGPARAADWHDAVDSVRQLAAALGVAITVRADRRPPWHPGRCAAICVGEVALGYAGELHPATCEALDAPGRTIAAEIDLGALLDLATRASESATAPVVSTFPAATRDIALVVGETVPAAEIETALRSGAGPLLEEVRLFDTYAGSQLEPGTKSLAWGLRFRAPDRTLTAEEVGGALDSALAAIATRTGATLRA